MRLKQLVEVMRGTRWILLDQTFTAVVLDKVDAGTSGKIVIWGDGTPTREFLYVDDAAEGILLAASRYNGESPLNLGSGIEISIGDLTKKICGLMDYNGNITFDTSKPNGQMKRRLDISKAALLLGFQATTEIDDGLKNTINWFVNSRSIPKDI